MAFPAIILGGLDSIPGAVVGGVIIGLIYVLDAGLSSQLASSAPASTSSRPTS